MSSTQHQLIKQCATRLRGIVEALDNIHDNTPHRWSTDLDDVHSSAESLLALIKDQAPARSEASFEEWLANELEGEDGQPVPAAACDITLARRAFNHWPKLEQPAKVGGVRFSAGVSSRLVVEAAQRLYEFESTPEKEAERIDPEQESVEQAGGDERVIGWRERILAAHPNSDPGFWTDALLVEHMAAEIADLRAALAQPSPVRSSLLINGYQLRAALDFIAPDGTAEQLESETCIEWRQQDADFLEAGLYAFCAEYPEEGGVLLDEEPTTAQPSPLQSEQAEAERPEVAEVAFVLRNIGAMDAEDIDGDNVDLRFEDAEGRDTGCDVSIVEYAEKAADLFEQHDRIVGELRADRDSWAEQAEQRLADWDEMRKERDAALANVDALAVQVLKLGGTISFAHHRTDQAGQVPQAWLDVQAERRRQITAEGWTPEHDDEHSHGQMARAAACYALAGSSDPNDGTAALLVSLAWPWDQQWWKPTSARRDLVKACALALAEIERLDRAGISQSPQPGATTASS
ncbi:hypothetical protein SOK29_08690 [Pseudomonas aeruginosa]|uniref:hypothetical protein n=1 Tax=Pseudomonas aeruginosa TaxID=287 RepID=UPI002A6AA021|nr:hypothetical protein [Pseudomonas aeruginosa]MDY1507404.1 hypothetical protein [Pseudomonas aeruginosa]